MTDPIKSDGPSLKVIKGSTPSTTPKNIYVIKRLYGGGSGEPPVDTETKHYLDAKVDAVKAQNDARFAEVLSKIDGLNPATWWQNALLLAATVGTVFAILAYASDRFDGGIAAMGLIEEQIDAQREQNKSQEERLDRILKQLEVQHAPEPSSNKQPAD